MTPSVKELQRKLLGWFREVARPLPWRGVRDPYAIWVSEVMLQQTRVETVLAYYERFMDLFPTLKALAEADQEAVLKAWEGMGYYARARNLHRAAREALRRYGGFPPTYEVFRQLPGVGDYTAAAVWAIAFGEPRLPLDGNIRRVLARLFDLEDDRKGTYMRVGKPLLEGLRPEEVRAMVQALMELGALICLPRHPSCARCPVAEDCLARQRGTISLRPPRRSRPPRPHQHVVLIYLQNPEGRVLITRRREEGLLGGLWELPGGKVEPGESLEQAIRREVWEEVGIREIRGLRYVGRVNHGYTHLAVTLHLFEGWTEEDVRRLQGAEEARWISPQDFSLYPFPRGTHKVLTLRQRPGPPRARR